MGHACTEQLGGFGPQLQPPARPSGSLLLKVFRSPHPCCLRCEAW
jgi:hypothetical protein